MRTCCPVESPCSPPGASGVRKGTGPCRVDHQTDAQGDEEGVPSISRVAGPTELKSMLWNRSFEDDRALLDQRHSFHFRGIQAVKCQMHLCLLPVDGAVHNPRTMTCLNSAEVCSGCKTFTVRRGSRRPCSAQSLRSSRAASKVLPRESIPSMQSQRQSGRGNYHRFVPQYAHCQCRHMKPRSLWVSRPSRTSGLAPMPPWS